MVINFLIRVYKKDLEFAAGRPHDCIPRPLALRPLPLSPPQKKIVNPEHATGSCIAKQLYKK